MNHETSTQAAFHFELRFRSLFHSGRALVFPCDSEGHVELDGFSENARANYLFARAMVGREYDLPRITERPDDDVSNGT
jgi:hypothetical protein